MSEEGWVVCRVFRKKNYQKSLESPKSSSSNSMDSKAAQMLCSAGNDGVLDQILLYMGRTCKMENDHQSLNNMINTPNTNTNTNSNNLRMLVANNEGYLHERFMHLPRLESPSLPTLPMSYQSIDDMLTETETDQPSSINQGQVAGGGANCDHHTAGSALDHDNNINESKNIGVNDWVTLDRLVASQLNGQETSKQLSCFTDPNAVFSLYHDDDDHIQLSNINLQRSNHQNSSQVYSNENDLWSLTKSSSSPSSSDPLCHLSV